MKIKVISSIYPPQNEVPSQGRRFPEVLQGEIFLELTPERFCAILSFEEIQVEGVWEFFIDTDNGYFCGFSQEKDDDFVTIETDRAYLSPGSKEEVGDRIRKLVQEGWELKLTREQNRGLEYPIQDLFKD